MSSDVTATKKSQGMARTAVPILILLGAIVTVFAWHFRLHFPIDDSFITFRYAEHLAQGHSLVWNIGGAHTEGYTNFLYIVLLAPSVLLHLDLLAYSQIINIFATVISGVLIYRIVQTILEKEFGALQSFYAFFIAAIFLVTPMVWINALSAMETSIFGVMILASFASFARSYYGSDWSKGSYVSTFLFAFLAALVRPEGALLGGIIWLVLLFNSAGRKRATTQFLLINALPLCIYHGWRYWYFGSWLPNSFLIKVVDPGIESHEIFHGVAYVRMFLNTTMALTLVSLFAWKLWRQWRVTWSIVLWSIAILAFYALPSAMMGFYDRFLFSVEVALFVLAGIGLFALMHKRAAWIKVIVLILFSLLHADRSWRSPRALEARTMDDNMANRYQRVGAILRGVPNHDQISFAFADAGVIPYYAETEHLDLVGLNDNQIARARSADEVVSIVATRKPDLLFIPVSLPGPDDDSCRRVFRIGHGLVGSQYLLFISDPRFRNYRELVQIHTTVYDIAVMENIQSVHARDIEAAFRYQITPNDTLLSLPPGCLD